jgi:hypothetical protein
VGLRFYGIGSGKTVSGLNRIIRILHPEIKIDCQGPMNVDDYDGVFCHNVLFADPFNGRLPRIVYLASGKAGSVVSSPKLIERIKANPPTELWVNQDTSRKLLEIVGIRARTMYRPNLLTIPEEMPEPFTQKKILWHFSATDPWMNSTLEKNIAKAMRKLSDFEIQVIGSPRGSKARLKPAGGGLNHVKPSRWLDLRTEAKNWAGVVRVYDAPNDIDLGRSTFQMFAFGRWYIYRNIVEPLVDAVENVKEVPALVRKLCDIECQKTTKKRWKYIKNHFSEKILRERWAQAIGEVIDSWTTSKQL